MQDCPLEAHSPQEAVLYVMVHPCAVCGHNVVTPHPQLDTARAEHPVVLGECDNCGTVHRYVFSIARGLLCDDPIGANQPLNPAAARSRIIDAVQWVSLYAHFAEQSSQTPDKHEARWRMIRAGECLDEALRFYDGNDLPSDDVLFTPGSKELVRLHQSRYDRSRLVDLRRKCPVMAPCE